MAIDRNDFTVPAALKHLLLSGIQGCERLELRTTKVPGYVGAISTGDGAAIFLTAKDRDALVNALQQLQD